MSETESSNQTRLEQMRELFTEFDAAHPEVWGLFVDFTFSKIRRGFEHYSADAVVHRIRWETESGADDPELKINDIFVAFYSRKFAETFPRYSKFFRRRKQRSAGYAASTRPEPTRDSFEEDIAELLEEQKDN